MTDHAHIVFSTIFPENLEAFRHAQQILTPDHFEGSKHARSLWAIMVRYSSKYSGIPTLAFLRDAIRKSVTKTSKSDFVVLEEMVARFVEEPGVSLSSFKASVDALHDEYIKTKTGRALVEAFEILEQGKEVDGETLHGHEAARDRIAQTVREIESEFHIGDISEGDATEDNDFVEEYARVKETYLSGDSGGIGFGITSLDTHVEGVMPGDLVLIGAFTGSGKTQMLCQMAWHASVNQGKNVFFSTTETVRRQVHSRIIARHSRLDKFGVDGGLNSKHILKGSLSAEHEDVMKDVLEDLRSGGYGSIYISQNTADATLDFVESRLVGWEQHTGKKADLMLIDSIYLLRPTRKRGTSREELVDLLQDSKRRATSLNIPVVSPWQITRDAWQKALDGNGSYNKLSFSDTSEAEKSASILVTLLRDEDDPSSLHVQVLKNRDGEEMPGRVVAIDLRNAFFTDPEGLDTSSFTGVDIGTNLLGAF